MLPAHTLPSVWDQETVSKKIIILLFQSILGIINSFVVFYLGIGCKHPMIDLKMLMYYLLLDFKIESVAENVGKNSVKLLRRKK